MVDTPDYRVLHRFRDEIDLEQWTTTSDRIVGGFSECSFVLNGKIGLFTGNISLETSGEMVRSGFATVRTKPEVEVPSLEPFNALELRLRTDGRPYVFNIKQHDMAEAIYQGKMLLPADRWFTVALPFSDFLLTHRGTIVPHQQEMDPTAISGFGVLLADGRPGPFRLEIESIRATREFDTAHYVRVPDGPGADVADDADAQAALLEAGYDDGLGTLQRHRGAGSGDGARGAEELSDEERRRLEAEEAAAARRRAARVDHE